MSKDIVAIDIDSVICNTEGIVCAYLQEKWNLYLDIEKEWPNFHVYLNPLLTKSVAEDIHSVIHAGWFLKKGEPYDGVVGSINRLREVFEIALVTGRREHMAGDDTIEWLSSYDIGYDYLYFTNGIHKEDVIHSSRAAAFVEDNFDSITMVLRKCGKLKFGIYCVDHCWNAKYFNMDVTRVKSLSEASRLILAHTLH